MKKLLLASLLAISTSAMADFHHDKPQNGQGNKAVSTVAQAKKARDDQRVNLTGYIVKKIDDDEFLFKDATGTVRIDVDDDAFRGQRISPKNKVRIAGKVDRDDNGKRVTLDIHSIQKLK